MAESRRARLSAFISRTRAAIDKRGASKSAKQFVLLSPDKNLLALGKRDCRRVDLRAPLASLIVDHFRQRSEVFAPELERLQKARDAVVEAGDDERGIQLIGDYYRLFSRLAIKLPPHCGVDFIWQVDGPIQNDSPSFERANVLYALAGVHSRLALEANRSTIDGLKKAHAHFQSAAGCVEYVLKHLAPGLAFLSTLDDSLSARHLLVLRSAFLGQAQECVWQKAALDEMKDKLVAQLAEQTSAYYATALDTAQASDTLPSSLIHYLSAKALHFSAIAQLRMSMAATSSRAFGEEIARLRLADDAAKGAMAHAEHVGNLVLKEAASLSQHVTKVLARAERDNDLIYLVTVPDSAPLRAIVPTSMVKPVLPDCVSSGADGAFDKLQPYVVRNVIETYIDRRNRAVREAVIAPLVELSRAMHETLSSLGLPGIIMAAEQPSGLPVSLIDQCEDVRRRGGLATLEQSSLQVQALLHANQALLEQIREIVEDERREDDESRSYYGSARWSRPASQDFFADQTHSLQRYENFLNQAQASDQLVKDKLDAWAQRIERLSLPEAELARRVPEAALQTPSVRREAERLKQVYLRWEQAEVERKALVEQADLITSSTSDDEFEKAAVALAQELQAGQAEAVHASAFEALMQQHISKHTAYGGRLDREARLNQTLTSELRDGHGRLQSAKSDANAPDSPRERVLQELSVAADRFDELVRNFDEGTKFYTDLHRALNRLGDEVQTMSEERMQEALGARQQIEQDSTRRSKRGTAWTESDGIRFK